ncbi:competence protein ComK [Neobacillus drentensis]|uniref:competence protein ComK n=1 Tax=Neobacillus drentensis TaxID=220684 RepID=UPI003002E785
MLFNLLRLKEWRTINIKRYFIEKKVILIMGEFDQYGKPCSRIMAGKTTFLVDKTPLHLLDDTLQYIGFDLRGAIIGAKSILNKTMKCPIMVNPYQGICLFPSKSPHKIDCIWFDPEHIINTKATGNKTEVELSNGHFIIVDTKFAPFNEKLQTAKYLKRLTIERGTHPSPILYYLEPPKRHQLLKEKSGKYNFEVLEEEKNNIDNWLFDNYLSKEDCPVGLSLEH